MSACADGPCNPRIVCLGEGVPARVDGRRGRL